MNFVLWEIVDTDLVPAKSPIGIDGVQQNGVVLRAKLRNPSPLTTSESLQDKEQDEHKRKILEEAEA